MTHIFSRHLLACGACALALGVAGCGGSSDDEPQGAKLPAATVGQINQRLDEIQRRFQSATQDDNPGACEDIASDSFPAISRLIDGLPADTDSELRNAVNESFANLQQLTDEGCRDVGTQTETETTPTETTPPETETVPPETETTPPDTNTQTAPEPPTTPQTPEENGGAGPDSNNGNGNGNGNGNDGGAGGGGSDRGGAVAPGQ